MGIFQKSNKSQEDTMNKTDRQLMDRSRGMEQKAMSSQDIHTKIREIIRTDYDENPQHKNPQYLHLSFRSDYTVSYISCTDTIGNHEQQWWTPLEGHFDAKRISELITEIDKILDLVQGQTAMTDREVGVAVRNILKKKYDEDSDRRQFLRIWRNYDNHIWKIDYGSETSSDGTDISVYKVPMDVSLEGHYDRGRTFLLLESVSDSLYQSLKYYEKVGHQLLGMAVMLTTDAENCVNAPKNSKSELVRSMRDAYPGAEFDTIYSRKKNHSWVVAYTDAPQGTIRIANEKAVRR